MLLLSPLLVTLNSETETVSTKILGLLGRKTNQITRAAMPMISMRVVRNLRRQQQQPPP
jgi:hypothetical protein